MTRSALCATVAALSLVAAATVALLTSVHADVLTQGTTLRVTFKAVSPVQPSPPDTLVLLLDHPFIQTPIGSYTANLFDGATLLGTHTCMLCSAQSCR